MEWNIVKSKIILFFILFLFSCQKQEEKVSLIKVSLVSYFFTTTNLDESDTLGYRLSIIGQATYDIAEKKLDFTHISDVEKQYYDVYQVQPFQMDQENLSYIESHYTKDTSLIKKDFNGMYCGPEYCFLLHFSNQKTVKIKFWEGQLKCYALNSFFKKMYFNYEEHRRSHQSLDILPELKMVEKNKKNYFDELKKQIKHQNPPKKSKVKFVLPIINDE